MVPVAMLDAWIMLSLGMIGTEIEQLLGLDNNDLPISWIVNIRRVGVHGILNVDGPKQTRQLAV